MLTEIFHSLISTGLVPLPAEVETPLPTQALTPEIPIPVLLSNGEVSFETLPRPTRLEHQLSSSEMRMKLNAFNPTPKHSKPYLVDPIPLTPRKSFKKPPSTPKTKTLASYVKLLSPVVVMMKSVNRIREGGLTRTYSELTSKLQAHELRLSQLLNDLDHHLPTPDLEELPINPFQEGLPPLDPFTRHRGPVRIGSPVVSSQERPVEHIRPESPESQVVMRPRPSDPPIKRKKNVFYRSLETIKRLKRKLKLALESFSELKASRKRTSHQIWIRLQSQVVHVKDRIAAFFKALRRFLSRLKTTTPEP